MKLTQCPICKNEKINKGFDCKDNMITQEIFSINSCSNCGFLFTNPRPDDSEMEKYYQGGDYVSHSESKKGLVNSLFILARKYTLASKVKLIKSLSKGRKILDIGCGSGSLLNACSKNGFTVTGMEPSEFARGVAKQNYGLDILPIEEIKTQKKTHDIISLWHVLEHVSDLDLYFQCFNTLLEKDGILLIALPNRESYDAAYYKEKWAAYDVPRHLWHFSEKDIVTLAKNHGFELFRKTPMKLDAFYISMLSEQYKHGKNKLVAAFFRGLKSNIWARRNDNKYSSLIYAFKIK